MKIIVSKPPPPNNVLFEIFKKEFSDKYTYRLFGIGKKKSIIVQKSTFVGAQISKKGNEFIIDGVHPSVTASLIALLLQVLANLFLLFQPSPYRELEKEIAVFLKQKYK